MVGYVIVAGIALVAGMFLERLISAPLHKAVNDLRLQVSHVEIIALRLENKVAADFWKARKKL